MTFFIFYFFIFLAVSVTDDLVVLRIKDVSKIYFVKSVGWMSVKMNEDIVEIIAAEILKRFGKYVW